MDNRLEQALNFSNFRLILATRQKNLKILLNNKLKISYKGGLFKIDKELITFLTILILRKIKSYILLDINDIPIKIMDLEDFLNKVTKIYEKAINQYYQSYQKLEEARDMRKVIDWDEN